MAKPQKLFTQQVLNHIQIWGKHLERDRNFYWSKHDSNIYFLLETEIKLLTKKVYDKRNSNRPSKKRD